MLPDVVPRDDRDVHSVAFVVTVRPGIGRQDAGPRDGECGSRPGLYEGARDTVGPPLSLVEGCTVTGGAEGIVTHYASASRDRVSGTSLRGITLTEMSMGMAERNAVDGATGIGILCGDHSLCELAGNTVSVRPDRASQDPTRMGYAIVSQFGAEAELHGKHVSGRIAAFLGGTFVRR